MLRFCKTPGHDLSKAGTVHSLSCTTANLCQKVDNSDQISSKSKLLKKAPTVDSKQARSKHEEKMKEAEKRGKERVKITVSSRMPSNATRGPYNTAFALQQKPNLQPAERSTQEWWNKRSARIKNGSCELGNCIKPNRRHSVTNAMG